MTRGDDPAAGDAVTTGGYPALLVLALGRDPLPAGVADAADRWQAAGVRLAMVTLTPRVRLTTTVRQVALVAGPRGPDGVDPSTGGAPRSTVRKAVRRLHLDLVRWPAIVLVLANPYARRLLTGADLVLAADPTSVLLGWLVGRRRGEGVVWRSVPGVDRALSRTGAP